MGVLENVYCIIYRIAERKRCVCVRFKIVDGNMSGRGQEIYDEQLM